MDPGSLDSLVKVMKRTETTNDFGADVTSRTSLGCFWCTITYVTKSLVYSGNEMLRPDASWPMPIVRFTFSLDCEFPYESTEFHFNGGIFLPREAGVRIDGPRGSSIFYNCKKQIKQIPVEGNGSGS